MSNRSWPTTERNAADPDTRALTAQINSALDHLRDPRETAREAVEAGHRALIMIERDDEQVREVRAERRSRRA